MREQLARRVEAGVEHEVALAHELRLERNAVSSSAVW